MARSNLEANCKNCKEPVLYTWRKCPYCGSRRFVRKYSLSKRIKTLNNCMGMNIMLWSTFYAIFNIFFHFLGKGKENIKYITLNPIWTLCLLMTIFFILFVAPALFFYIIHPIRHYTGKKVTIEDVAKNCEDDNLSITAINRITDQNVLADVAENAKSKDARIKAAEKLKDIMLC